MSLNRALCRAKSKKDDEFYTRLPDVENELARYQSELAGKIVFCAFDGIQSTFVQYLDQNYETLGLKALCSAGLVKTDQGCCLEIRIRNENGVSHETKNDVQDSFDSEAWMKLFDASDIIITNPSFSRMLDLLGLMLNRQKKFLIIGAVHMMATDLMIDAIARNQVWTGVTKPRRFLRPDGSVMTIGGGCWYTNLIPAVVPQCIFDAKYDADKYLKYLNYDAIDVPKMSLIPSDYFGVMGVSVTILMYFSGFGQGRDDGRMERLAGTVGTWFDIIGLAPRCLSDDITYGQEFYDRYKAQGGTARISPGMKGLAMNDKNGRAILPYRRVLIQRKSGRKQEAGQT